MAIFKCNTCSHLQEVQNTLIDKNARCPKCQQISKIYNTLSYITNLLEENTLLKKKIEEKPNEIDPNTNSYLKVYDPIPLEDFDIHNTNMLSKKSNYSPIIKWFKEKNIQAEVDPKMMDTTGFFDEIAIDIGEQYNSFGPIINQIRYIQNKNYETVKITLSKYSDSEIKKILAFCKKMHLYSFIVRYNFKKKDKIIYLTIQDIPRIKNFFNGLWMEWFVLIKLLILFKENETIPAIARGVNITFQNNNKNELDIFLLNNLNQPICIECKTGEFRQDLSKYLTLRKKLNVKKEHFILCVFGIDEEQTRALTSMYEITLVNESTLVEYIQSLFNLQTH
jgi:DNA-directed RNA polymerase subunit RPC12/RpoP